MKKRVLLILYSITFGILNSQNIKYEDREVWEPEPTIVSPGSSFRDAPSDAIVLFNGLNLNKWIHKNGEPAKWDIKDGYFTVRPGSGSILTKDFFGSCQLHLEFMTPVNIEGDGQNRGNSGVFLMENIETGNGYEVQVLDSYNNRTYSNGQAGSIYEQHIPLVNASKKPGEWQTYDIIFKAPLFNKNGEVKSPAYITIFHNGVLIQDNSEIKGFTNIGYPKYEVHPSKLPIKLQDHGNLVSFRNIWLREL